MMIVAYWMMCIAVAIGGAFLSGACGYIGWVVIFPNDSLDSGARDEFTRFMWWAGLVIGFGGAMMLPVEVV